MFLRHRSAKSLKSRHPSKQTGDFSAAPALSLSKARRKGDQVLQSLVERLECRRLLTTLHGGDTLVFKNEDGNFETVAAFGNITAEVIGANVDGGNNLILEDLPGLLDGAPVNGGLTPPPGATLVGNLTIPTPTGAPLVIPPTALTVDPTNGQLWAIAIQTVPAVGTNPATNACYLIKIDKTTGNGMVVSEISQEVLSAAGIPPGTPNAEVTGIPAAAFNPTNDLLYFTAQTGAAVAGTMVPGGTETLMTIDPNNANPPTTVTAIPGNLGGQIASAITFNGNQIIAAAGQTVFTVNTLNSNLISVPVMANVNAKISGLAEANGLLYATTSSGTASEVYTINVANGTTIDYGPLPNGNLGQNPGNLAFDPQTNQLFSDDLQTKQLFTVSEVNRTRYLSVFQIYVSQSDSSGQIFESQSSQAGVMTPFGAGISGLNIINAQTHMRNMIPSPANSGDGLIGARTRTITAGMTNQMNIPITTGTLTTTFGSAPYAIGDTITAGYASAPGTNIGMLALSGTLMGAVNLQGSVDTMFVGWLLTGNTDGEIATNEVSDPDNFTVDGDMRNLLVGASIGTDSDKALNLPTYVTGFDMLVGGTVGRIQTFDSIIGNMNVVQSPTAPALGTNISETEQRTTGIPNPWDAGLLSGNNAFFYNDTFATAQTVGAIPAATGDQPSQVVIDGLLAADTTQKDVTDYYAVSLLAGQTVTCQVIPTAPAPPIDLGVYNPDGTEIATDYNDVDQGETENAFFRFTADRPGLYRFAVADNGNTTFSSAYGTLPGDTPYQLTVQNVGDLAVGGILAATNILDNVDPTKPEASFGVQNGDLGALLATSDIMSTNGGDTVNIADGNFRELTAGSLGLLTGSVASGTPSLDTEIQVPNGSVGLVNTTSATGILYFNYPLPVPSVPPAIGGNYQLVSTASDLDVKLVADGSIGVIRGPNIQTGTGLSGPCEFFVNHDNSTTPGNIDLIDTPGGVGSALLGGPRIMTGPEGNVGFFRAGGTVYRDQAFGASQPEATLYSPDEAVTLTDDSGAQVVITPTDTPSVPPVVGTSQPTGGITVASGTAQGGTTTSIIFASGTPGAIIGDTVTLTSGPGAGQTSLITAYTGGVATVAPGFSTAPTTATNYNITQQVTVNPNLPQLTITAYGIEGSGGVAIMNVTSTGGVTITGTGDVPGQVVQIGVIDAQGLGQGLVQSLLTTSTGSQPLPPSSTTTSSTSSSTTGTTTGTTSGGATTSGTTAAPTYYSGADTAGPRGRTQILPLPPIANPNSVSPLDVVLGGTAQMDAFEVDGGFFTSIQDNTVGGEIVNVNAASVGTLSSKGTIGLAQNHTGMVLNGENVVANTFPLIDTHNAVSLGTAGGVAPGGLGPVLTAPLVVTQAQPNGTTVSVTLIPVPVGGAMMGIGTIQAAQGIGNLNITGSVGTIQASIDAPVFVSGSIFHTTLGSGGIAPSGSGAISLSGLYADGQIGVVSNSAPADIRGNIISQTGITGINLTHGSIINADIGDLSALVQSTEISPMHIPTGNQSPISNPVLDIGNIIVTGNGGIVGTAFFGRHFGQIDSIHGFGIFESAINVNTGGNNTGAVGSGDATVTEILADGYGIRDFTFEGGSSIGKIIATGNGQNVSTQVYSADVRLSQTDTFDPFFGIAPGLLTDINAMTGATAAHPQVPGAPGTGTDTGVIDTSYFYGNRDLTSVKAYQIRTPPSLPPTTFSFADSIGTITTLSAVNGMSVLTGRLQSFHPGGQLSNLSMTIAGPIRNLKLVGDVTGSSSISATGINGNIGTLNVTGNLQGSITATRKITSAVIGGNLTGTVTAPIIGTLKIKGIVNGGNLNIQGKVTTLQLAGNLGLPGETVTIEGSAKMVKIKGDLNANLTIQGNLGTLSVGGSIISGNTVDIAGNLNLLAVNGDIQTGATVMAALIKKEKVKGVVLGVVS